MHVNNNLNVQLKILDDRIGKEFAFPNYATEGSAGIDLKACCTENVVLKADECQLVSTGISIYIADKNYVALITPRSGLGVKQGIVLGNLTGVIDSDYQGPLMVPLWNRSILDFTIEPGMRMAQLLIVPVMQANFQVVKSFDTTSTRGEGGFGHSGLK